MGPKYADRESEARTLWAGDLPAYADETFLRNALRDPHIIRMKVNTRRAGQLASDGYAFLEFNSVDSATQFMNKYYGQLIPGTQVPFKLDWAQNGGAQKGPQRDDYHSIFVGELSAEVTDQDLLNAFARLFPSAKASKVVRNPATNASRGFGFVRFTDKADHDAALRTMHGFMLGHKAIRVSAATAKRQTQAEYTAPDAATMSHVDQDPHNTTLFVGNVSSTVSDELLRQYFAPFGEIVYTKVPPGKSCGFVQMVHRADAEKAMGHLQGHVIGGLPIRIAWGKSSGSAAPMPQSHNAYAEYAYPAYDPYYAYGQHTGMDMQAQDGSAPATPQDSLFSNSHSFLKPFLDIHASQGYDSFAKANAEYMLRHQTSLLGPLTS